MNNSKALDSQKHSQNQPALLLQSQSVPILKHPQELSNEFVFECSDISKEELLNICEYMLYEYLLSVFKRKEWPKILVPSRHNKRLFLQKNNIIRSRYECKDLFFSKDSTQYAAFWLLLTLVHRNLTTKESMTQREVYYHLKYLGVSPKTVYHYIQNFAAFFGCPMSTLQIYPSAKALVYGKGIFDPDSRTPRHTFIPGDFDPSKCFVHHKYKYVVITEKEGIYDRVAREEIPEKYSALLICSKGYPDLATRKFVHHLIVFFPEIIPLGLFDYNISGLEILLTFKMGSKLTGTEGYKYCCPEMGWLGLHHKHIQKFEQPFDFFFEEPKQSELARVSRLESYLEKLPKHLEELWKMKRENRRLDLDRLCDTKTMISLIDNSLQNKWWI